MKNGMGKRLSALLLAAAMVFSLAACGSDSKQEEDTASGLTKEEYQQAVQTLSTEISEIQDRASEIDGTDVEQTKELLDELKTPLQDFMAIDPPESYAAGHAKLQSGCQSLIEYIDLLVDALGETDQTALQESSEQMQTLMESAVADLQEGAPLLGDADSQEE
ncbi:DUF6376 family protein [Agathobaculum sp. Marseille-P7918]|uniref:DUF6376 family protein n=1 Tax=Agathobaculum sp. Marseille-P7918 TaxID=2479843 RepID=UPI000F631C4F|nr:DUF6376 family protein [Agathobaculum sp. Marseille-P7918]